MLSLIILVIIIVGRFIKIPDSDDNNYKENPSLTTEYPTTVLEYDDDEEWEAIKPIRADSSVN